MLNYLFVAQYINKRCIFAEEITTKKNRNYDSSNRNESNRKVR